MEKNNIKKTLPKYEKIKDYIIQGIKSRNFTDAVPSENQLAATFSVSRMTARRALREIEKLGFINRIPGKGTFVKKKNHYTTGFFRVRPFQKWAEDLNVKLTAKVLETGVIDPPAEVMEKLQHPDQVILIRRLCYFDDTPVRYEIHYLRADLCAGILWENLQDHSIHDILINTYNLPLTRMSQRMEAVILSAEDAPLFKEAPGYPLFRINRTVYSFNEAVTYVEYFMRGEMAFNDDFSPHFEHTDFVPRE